MLTFEEAKKIGKNACIEMLGRSFYEKYIDSSTTAYGDFSEDGVIFCYVGVNDHPQKKPPGGRRKLLPTAPALFGRGIIDDDKQMGRRCLKPAAVRAQSSTSSFPS